MSVSDDLLPCPFCDGPADFIGSEGAGYNVECKHCGSQSGWGDYGYQVEELWNRRTAKPAPKWQGIREALNAALEMSTVMEGLTGCRSDDDYVWGVQEKLKSAIEALPVAPIQDTAK